jgi:MFS family permease
MSIVPNLVPREQLHNAIALTSVTFNLSRFVGPAIAGFVISVWGVGTAFVINGISYLSLIAAMLVVNLNPSSNPGEARKHPWIELTDGARYAFTHKGIRGLLLLAALGSVFGRGALEMLPVFADAVYRGGASALAILTSSIGGGAVLAGLVLSRGTRWLTRGVIHGAIAVSGLLVIALGSVNQFPVAAVVVAMLGITLSLSGVGSQILIQTMVDDEVRGRVSSFWGMIAFGGTSLGSLLVGAAAHAWGLQNAVIATGMICVLATFVAARVR